MVPNDYMIMTSACASLLPCKLTLATTAQQFWTTEVESIHALMAVFTVFIPFGPQNARTTPSEKESKMRASDGQCEVRAPKL